MLQKLLEEYKQNFSKSDYKIMECLVRNQRDIASVTTESLMEALGISSSTISRFWGKIGFRNLKDFKKQMRAANLSTPSIRTSSALEQWHKVAARFDSLTVQYENHISLTLENIQPEAITKAVAYMTGARKLYYFAADASAGLASILAYRCRRLGLELMPIPGGSGIYESMINLGSRDVVLMFGYSKILAETRILLQNAQKIHYKTVLFTDLLLSPETELSDVTLYSYRGEPNDYHSMVAPMVIIDLLILKLTEERKNSVENMKYLEQLRDEYSWLIKR